MKLTDTAIKKAKIEAKQYKMVDGDGMYLLVHPNGGKYWQMAYRFAGKQKTLALGVYPAISLADARARRNDARKILANGSDPGAIKQALKQAKKETFENNFEALGRECFSVNKSRWTESHALQWIKYLERCAFPVIGAKPITEINSSDLLKILRPIEQAGHFEKRERLIQSIGAVFKYAIALGKVSNNPARDIRAALLPLPKEKNFACILSAEIPEFLRALSAYESKERVAPLAITATRLLMLTAVRTAEVRYAKWIDFDLENAIWIIPAEQEGRKGRKGHRRGHIVPLSRQAIDLLKAIKPISGHLDQVFPNRNGQGAVISENTVNKVIESIGYKGRMTGHGFRTLARTSLGEMGHRFEVLEAMLSHKHESATVAAYDRAQYIEERRKMMQQYADYLDSTEQGGEVIPFHYNRAQLE